MRYIFHISDIHISSKNYNNIKFSFQRLIEDIKPLKRNSILVIAGDIFENKTFLLTDDISFFNDLIQMIEQEEIQTIIVPGNHDFNINAKLSNNNITILIKDSKYIKCISETSEVQIENINFGIYSLLDNEIPNILPNKTNIAILHEPINNAIYDNGETIQGARFGVKDFKQWNYVLLGDIHKPQFLANNIAYSGSFVQKNKGEGLNHGYILWDLEHGIGKHIYIPLVEVYLKIYAENDTCEVPTLLKNQKVRYITLMYKKCTADYLEYLKKSIEKKYGFINKIIDNNLYSSLIKLDQPINIEEKKQIEINTTELLKDMLDKNSFLENKLKETILTKHKELLQNKQVIHYTTYSINYLYWSNILCYGEDNYIDFTNFKNDIVILNGNNKIGKSSIIDILIRILFNECYRGKKEDILNKNKKKGCIKLSINISNDTYILEQYIIKTAKQVFHRVYKNGVNITQDTIIHTYQYISNVIGIGSYKYFVNMTTALQNRQFLVDLDRKDLLKLLSNILDLDMLGDLEKQISSDIRVERKVKKEIFTELELRTKSIDLNDKGKLSDQLIQIKTYKIELDKKKNNINSKLQQLNNKYNNIFIPNDIEEKLLELEPFKDFQDINKEEILNKINILHKKLGSYETKIDKEFIPNKYKEPVISLEKFNTNKVKINELKRVISNYNISVVNLDNEQKYKDFIDNNTIQDTKNLYTQLKPCNINDFYLNTPREFTEDMEREIDKLNAVITREEEPKLGLNLEQLNLVLGDYSIYENYSIDELRQNIVYVKEDVIPKLKPDNIDKYDEYIEFVKGDKIQFYLNIEKEIQLLQEQINQFTSKYGNFIFKDNCDSCLKNKTILKSLFDIEQNTKTLEQLKNIYKDFTDYKNQLENTKQYIKVIDDYKTNAELVKKIRISKDCKSVLDTRRDIEILSNLVNKRRFQYLVKCRENSILAYNNTINTKIKELEDNNNLLELYKLEYSNIQNYKNIKILNELEEENKNFINFKLTEIYNDSLKIKDKISSYEKIILHGDNKVEYFKLLKLKNINQDNKVIKRAINELNCELTQLDNLIRNNDIKYNEVSDKLNLINYNVKEIERLTLKIKDIDDEIRWKEVYQKCIEHKNGIPAVLLSNVCNLLSTRINAVLTQITDFTVDIKYDNEFKIYTIENDKVIPADMGSGFQKFIVDVIMRIVLTKISVLSNPNMIFIDEGFGCLDKENFIEVAKILKKLKHNFSSIIIITHISELSSYADYTLNINKVNGFSKITYGDLDIQDYELKVETELKEDAKIVREHKKKNTTIQTDLKEDNNELDILDILIEIREDKYYCRACDLKRKNTPNAIQKHLNSSSYASKHSKFIKVYNKIK